MKKTDELIETVRAALENCIRVAEAFGMERAKEAHAADFTLIPLMKRLERCIGSARTVQESREAFAQFQQVIKEKKMLEGRPVLDELTQGWTRADYFYVSKEALSFYGLDRE